MLSVISLPPQELVAIIIATSFAAGLNVSATIATLGLLAQAGVVALPPPLAPLANWWVIGASSGVFLVEFVVDKIPLVDLVWNGLQTFLRVPAGALLAYGAAAQLSPGQQLLAAGLGGAIALVAHGGKTVARATVSASPEPVSNFVLSLGEDAFAVFITWFATQYPYLAAGMVLVVMIAIVVLVRTAVRASRALFSASDRR